MRSRVRSLRRDLLTLKADPLPLLGRPGPLRRLPHVLVAVAAAVVVIADSDQLGHRNELGLSYGILLALWQGGALLLALTRPVLAWWLSLAATAVAALASAPHLIANTPWPWTVPGLWAHAGVLLLLSLRLSTGPAVAALGMSVLVPALIELTAGGRPHQSNSFPDLVLFCLTVIFGITARSRREARTRLAEQADLTEGERARRTLLEERGRIARELHDVVAHHMSVISIQAQVAPHLIDNPEELTQNLAGIRHNALDALTELRRMLGVLRSEDVTGSQDRHGSQPTLDDLEGLVANVRAAGLSLTTDITGGLPRQLAPGAGLSAYRIAQEALSNCLRHAPGSHVHLRVRQTDTALGIEVTNTAPTTPPAPSPGSGHGLLGMRERVAMLGGRLTAGPDAEGGYRISAHLPLDVLLTTHDDRAVHDPDTGPGTPQGRQPAANPPSPAPLPPTTR
ncbi:sensor histidine kinase [Streptomyces cinerochromogenes]|uniref:histidine kinase n=1 Tax=Streptomyces cinerochromogenes TaxID=66422 RepID=A0ABW7BDT9_9ACTN